MLYPYLTGLSPMYYRATGQLVLTTADQPVPGMVVPGAGFVSDGPETLLFLVAADMNIVTAGVGVCSYSVYVDGNSRGGGGSFGLGATGVGRASIMSATLGAMNGGTHSVQVMAKKSTAGGAANVEVASVSAGNVSQSYLAIMRFKTQPTLLAEIVDAVRDTFPEGKPA
jgi:hypothetical protein